MDSVHDLLEYKLQVIYAGEKRALEIIEDAMGDAQDEKLRAALEHHRDETEGQVSRVEKAFESLGRRARTSDPAAIEGIVEERRRFLREDASPALLDAFVVGASMKVEHVEIAQYEEVILLAERAGVADLVAPLRTSLEEERAALEKLRALGAQLKLDAPAKKSERAQEAR